MSLPLAVCMTNKVVFTIGRFLDLIQSEPESNKSIGLLFKILDELAWLAHSVEYDFDDTDYLELPEFDQQATYKSARKWLQAMQQDENDSIEAIMDLSELTDDLEEIYWRFNNTSEADALFHYLLGFQSHWGHHLRSLQKAIHEWYW